MIDPFKIELCSPPDREKLVATIMFHDEQWAELNQESGSMTLEIYPKQDGQPWTFDFESAMNALTKAKERLAES